MSEQEQINCASPNTADELLSRIGQLTRQMHEGIRELGLDRGIAKAAEAIPNACDRLNYISEMTERAAVRALNAVDIAQPLQETIAKDAKALSERWIQRRSALNDGSFAGELELDTEKFLTEAPGAAIATNAQLKEIMMAQDFQDLTGQVIKKLMDVIKEMETQLLQLLIDNSQTEKQADESDGSLSGPQLKVKHPEAVSDQSQVDDLLASLGF